MERLWPEIVNVMKEVRTVQPMGQMDQDRRQYIASSRSFIIERVRDARRDVRSILGVYDAAYEDLVARDTPKTFRDFLLSAPHLFLELGEKIGALWHISSFWRFRFPQKARLALDVEEFTHILCDFTSSFPAASAPRLVA